MLVLLLATLSGCRLRDRRSGENPYVGQNQPQENTIIGNETTPPSQTSGPIVPQSVSTATATATSIQEDDRGQTLEKQLDSLNAANQAGDSFDDLP